jgi:hypothetical protein
VVQLLQQIVGVHTTWAEVVAKCGCFVPMQIEPLILSKKKSVFARMLLHKPWDNPDVWKSIQKRTGWNQVRLPLSRESGGPKGFVCLETPLIRRRARGCRQALTQLATSVRGAGIHALLTRQGYRLYLSDFGTKTPCLPQLASI